jgi:hypothetical protein
VPVADPRRGAKSRFNATRLGRKLLNVAAIRG